LPDDQPGATLPRAMPTLLLIAIPYVLLMLDVVSVGVAALILVGLMAWRAYFA
jgi:hypothetical protein